VARNLRMRKFVDYSEINEPGFVDKLRDMDIAAHSKLREKLLPVLVHRQSSFDD
jgi:hypothetical protein